MTSIEVPDWVVRSVAGAMEDWHNNPANETGYNETLKAALSAALGAWVVPAQFQSRERFMDSDWSPWHKFDYPHDRDSDFDRMNNADGWQAEKRDLFTLRQEKPE